MYLVSARGGDRRGARGRARRSRARCPSSRFLALAGQEVGAFFRRPPPRRPSPLPACAPRPPGTSASFPFWPPAPPLLSPDRPWTCGHPPRPAPTPPGLSRLCRSICPLGAGSTFLPSASTISNWQGLGAVRPHSSLPCLPSLCVSRSSSLLFLCVCFCPCPSLCLHLSLSALRFFLPAPRPLLLPVVSSPFLTRSLLSPSPASPSVISPPVAFLESQGSASPCPFFYGPYFFCLLLLSLCQSVVSSVSLSSLALSLHHYLSVSVPLSPLAQNLYLCSSCVIASGSPQHPQFRAIDFPHPTSTSSHPENRCGHDQNLVPISPYSALCLWDLALPKLMWLPGYFLCPPLLRHITWDGPLPKTLPISFRGQPRLATCLQAWGVGRGCGRRGLGPSLDSWVPEKEEGVPMRSLTPATVCSWEGFIITKWPWQSRDGGGDTNEAATISSPRGRD